MTVYLTFISALLLGFLLLGLVRVMRGPTPADRMLATQMFGTCGVAILLLLAVIQEQPSALNAALVLALLVPLTLIAFFKLTGGRQ